MKTLKAARKAQDALEQARLRKAVWAKFVRGLRCPYCNTPRATPEHLAGHIDKCRRETKRREGRENLPPPDPDFPTLGKPVKGSMRWKVLNNL